MAKLTKAKETAEVIGLNRYTLYKGAAAGQIPHYKQGRAIRFDIDELRAWMRRAGKEGQR